MPEYGLGFFPKVDSYFLTNDLIGGCGGDPFHFVTLDKGSSLTELRVCLREDALCAIDFTAGRGEDKEVKSFGGYKISQGSKLCLGESEKITELLITFDEEHFDKKETKKSFLRGISIKTNKGQKFEIMPKKSKNRLEILPKKLEEKLETIKKKLESGTVTYIYSVGSGICCGIFGYADHNFIYSIGFAMLQPVKEALLKNVTYSDEDESTKTFPQLISSCVYTNKSALDQSHQMKATKTLELSNTWGTAGSIAHTLGFKVEAGYPNIFKIGGDYTWTKSSTKKHDHTSTKTETTDFEWSVNCSPRSRVEAKAILYLYEIESKYDGTMELRMESGKVFSYEVKEGTFKGINRSHCELDCEETRLEPHCTETSM